MKKEQHYFEMHTILAFLGVEKRQPTASLPGGQRGHSGFLKYTKRHITLKYKILNLLGLSQLLKQRKEKEVLKTVGLPVLYWVMPLIA